MGLRVGTAKWMENQSRWQIKVQKDGQRRTFTCSTPGRAGQRDANAKADAWLDGGQMGGKKRVRDAWPAYAENQKLKTYKGNHRRIDSIYRIHIEPIIGHVVLTKLNDQLLQNIIDTAAGERLSRKTLMNIRAVTVSFIKFCRKSKWTSYVPEDIMIPESARYKPKKILQPEELLVLFSCDTTILRGERVFDEYIYAYRFAVLTDLRPGELRGLTRSNDHGSRIQITRSINIDNDITQGKNQNAIRSIELSKMAREVLDKQISMIGDREDIFGIASTHTFYNRWRRYQAANGIGPISLYELRHTFVSVAQTVLTDGQLKAIVGHSKSMDTYGTYAHEVDGMGKDIAAALDTVFGKLLSNEKTS